MPELNQNNQTHNQKILKNILISRPFLSFIHVNFQAQLRKRLFHNLHLQNQTKKVLDDHQQQTNEFE